MLFSELMIIRPKTHAMHGLDHVHDFRNNVNQQGDYLVFPRNLPIANNIKHNYIHHLIVNSEIR